VHVPGSRAEARLAIREFQRGLVVRSQGADRDEATLAVQARTGLRRHPQAGLPRDAKDRLVLQLGQREVIGHLAEDLGQRRVERAADGGEQFGRGFLLPALDL
jgi:hypothetical protein